MLTLCPFSYQISVAPYFHCELVISLAIPIIYYFYLFEPLLPWLQLSVLYLNHGCLGYSAQLLILTMVSLLALIEQWDVMPEKEWFRTAVQAAFISSNLPVFTFTRVIFPACFWTWCCIVIVGTWLRVTKVCRYLPEQTVPEFVLFLSPVAAVEFQNWSMAVGLKQHQGRAWWLKSEPKFSYVCAYFFPLFPCLFFLLSQVFLCLL